MRKFLGLGVVFLAIQFGALPASAQNWGLEVGRATQADASRLIRDTEEIYRRLDENAARVGKVMGIERQRQLAGVDPDDPAIEKALQAPDSKLYELRNKDLVEYAQESWHTDI